MVTNDLCEVMEIPHLKTLLPMISVRWWRYTSLIHGNQWSLWGDWDTPPLIHGNQWSLWGDGDTPPLIHGNQWSLWGDGDYVDVDWVYKVVLCFIIGDFMLLCGLICSWLQMALIYFLFVWLA